jgi:class 3 adenylate cyclase
MLAAIARLNDATIAELPVPPPGSLKPQPPVASTAPPTLEAAGERRHVTVMFCDLVDSTGIAARLDARLVPRRFCHRRPPSEIGSYQR